MDLNGKGEVVSERETGSRNGGEILVSALRIHGVDTVFGVPGESALPFFNALLNPGAGVRFVPCRHEANASHMAEADAKIRGLPGVCIVSRGPGAMHAAIGLHTARQDSTPMVLIIGQVSSMERGREGFQEVDYTRVFADMTKWVGEVNTPDLLPEFVSRAFHIATHGRPGPVVLCVPEDVLETRSDVADFPMYRAALSGPSNADMSAVAELLGKARRPLVIVGGSGWSAESSAQLTRFCVNNNLPVVAGFRSQDIFDNRLEQYLGDLSPGSNPALTQRVEQADLLLVIGDRLSEITTKAYTALKIPVPDQTLVHVFPGPEDLGSVYNPHLPLLSSVSRFTEALETIPSLDPSPWTEWTKGGREAYEEFQKGRTKPHGLDIAAIIKHLSESLPEDAIITNGAGNYNIWLHRFFRYKGFGTQIAPKSGSMGYGLPAAIAAKLRHPGRTVVALAGDGCFMMASPDFATAVQNRLGIIVIIVNNGIYGTIRMHQERHYPGRPSGTSLENPDFAMLARSHGVFGTVVEHEDQFPEALEQALGSGGPAIIELRVSDRQLTPDFIV